MEDKRLDIPPPPDPPQDTIYKNFRRITNRRLPGGKSPITFDFIRLLKAFDHLLMILLTLITIAILLLPVIDPEYAGSLGGRMTKAFKTEMLKSIPGNENKR